MIHISQEHPLDEDSVSNMNAFSKSKIKSENESQPKKETHAANPSFQNTMYTSKTTADLKYEEFMTRAAVLSKFSGNSRDLTHSFALNNMKYVSSLYKT